MRKMPAPQRPDRVPRGLREGVKGSSESTRSQGGRMDRDRRLKESERKEGLLGC